MNATTPPEYLTEVDDVATVTPTPWSQEAEQSVLGALMLDNRAFDRCADVLQERSFWHASHRTIWATIAGQIMANRPADPLTVHDALKAAKIYVRYFPGPATGEYLRITVGTEAQADALLRHLV